MAFEFGLSDSRLLNQSVPTGKQVMRRITSLATPQSPSTRRVVIVGFLTAWKHCGHAWGNPPVPCLPADPVPPDCAPGETVRARGRLWFYEGKDIEQELERAKADFLPLTTSQ